MKTASPVIVALDFPRPGEALDLAARLEPSRCRVKVGKELFTRAGPDIVRRLNGLGFDVFLDLKFHDIPETVAAACRAAAELDVWMLNVHASGGRAMLEAARGALSGSAPRPLLIAVTVLTSLDDADLREVGYAQGARRTAALQAALAGECGLDGVVCSAADLAAIRAARGARLLAVTPGIRPAGSGAQDQKRILTPALALAAGADYLVIGRPITASDDPLRALARIESECASQPLDEDL